MPPEILPFLESLGVPGVLIGMLTAFGGAYWKFTTNHMAHLQSSVDGLHGVVEDVRESNHVDTLRTQQLLCENLEAMRASDARQEAILKRLEDLWMDRAAHRFPNTQ